MKVIPLRNEQNTAKVRDIPRIGNSGKFIATNLRKFRFRV